MPPLNGKRFHPLSAAAWHVLHDLDHGGPFLAATINPEIRNRLCSCDPPLAEALMASNKWCIQITDAGRTYLKEALQAQRKEPA